jgi:hypothetical protein
MPFPRITRGERAFLIAALVAAFLVASLAGFAAYEGEAEAQFHGGVLPEDAAEAQFALAWQFASAFLAWGIGIALFAGVVLFLMRRFFNGRPHEV